MQVQTLLSFRTAEEKEEMFHHLETFLAQQLGRQQHEARDHPHLDHGDGQVRVSKRLVRLYCTKLRSSIIARRSRGRLPGAS